MKPIYFAGVVSLSLLLLCCEKALVKPDPATDNLAVFDEFSQLVKEKYAMLDFKGVDIDHLSDSLRNFVNNDLTEDSLFSILDVVVQRLRDSHTLLIGNVGEQQVLSLYDNEKGYPVSMHVDLLINYISSEMMTLEDGSGLKVFYGRLPQDEEIAYLLIPSFLIELTTDELETIFASLNSAKGMIVDIRPNRGGDGILATQLASYFTDQEVYIGYENFKTGPRADDFVKSHARLAPANSAHKFTKPVAVLIGRRTYSASTIFCYSVNPLSHVTFIGQRSGGGSGSVDFGYLANGWRWQMSVSEFVGIDDQGEEQHLDDGFEPDIPVLLDTLDKTKDEIIERAIVELS